MEELIGVLNYTDLKVNSSGGGDLSNYYTKGETDNQIKKSIDKIKVPTKVSELENDAGYLTQHQDISNLATKSEVSAVESKIPAAYELPTASATTLGGVKVGNGLSITNGVLSATGGGGVADSVEWDKVQNKPNFANVATSGDYNDLSNKPTIPSVAGLASEAYVNEKVAAIKVPSLDGYAKTADLSTVATSGSYNDLVDKPTIPSVEGLASETYVDTKVAAIVIPEVPTKVSELENDAGYLTEHQSLAEYAKKTEIPAPYTLPTASTSTLGGVKVDGNTITIADGVISAKGGSGGGTADVFTGVGEDTITTEKTFEDSSFSFNKSIFLEAKGVKEKGYGYYQLRSDYKESWYRGDVYYSENGTSGWIACDNIAIQGGSAPYGCVFKNSSFFVSGVNNTITIHYIKGAAGTTGLVPAPTDNGKVLGSNGEWISVNMVSTIKTGTGTNSEKFNDDNNKASGNYSHAEGQNTEANGTAAHAEGYKTSANSYSHSEGYLTNAQGKGSHCEGYNNNSSTNYMMAQGQGSHCEGYTTIATKRAAHAGSHMEGYSDNSDGVTQQYAQGQGSHCEGWNTYCANSTTAAAHTEGRGTAAGSAYQHIEGKYNIIDTESIYQHIVGNGTENIHRNNSHTLDWQGNAVFAGTVSNSGADYAEYFEWLDENDNVDDRVGYIVTREGNKIKFANSEDDVLGIVSGTATVLGDNAEWERQGKYLKDEFGRKIIDWVEQKKTTTIDNDD